MSLSRKSFMALSAVVLVALLIQLCGSNSTSPEPTTVTAASSTNPPSTVTITTKAPMSTATTAKPTQTTSNTAGSAMFSVSVMFGALILAILNN